MYCGINGLLSSLCNVSAVVMMTDETIFDMSLSVVSVEVNLQLSLIRYFSHGFASFSRAST